MTARANPSNLNALQLRTLAVLQAAARDDDLARPDGAGGVRFLSLPHAHGDHVHVGDSVVSAREASGLANPSVWNALARKGLARADFPRDLALTPEGLAYDTTSVRLGLSSSDHGA